MAKNYKEYDIKRPGFTDTVKVRIYKTAQKMRTGNLLERKKYYKKPDILPDNTAGIFFPSPSFKPKDTEGVFNGECKCAHASFAHERDINRYKMDYGDDSDIEHEKRFCYYLGWLAAEVLELIKKDGYIK